MAVSEKKKQTEIQSSGTGKRNYFYIWNGYPN